MTDPLGPMRSLLEASAQQIDARQDTARLWRLIDRFVAKGELVPIQGTGVRYALLNGYILHMTDLRPLLDGWTPETVRSGQHVGNRAGDETHPDQDIYADSWGAMMAQAKTSKGNAVRASNPRPKNKWTKMNPEALEIIRRIKSKRPGLTVSSVAKIVLDEMANDHSKIPPRSTIMDWIKDFDG